jgi:NADH-quinone oxidoreductase subunit L
MFLIFTTFGSLDFRTVANAAGTMPVETAGFGVVSLITLLLFVGATGKSAQIPLFVWLPDAMEGPTPVSALIHAATMVTAGVYMVGRNAVLFSHAPETMQIVAIVGVATAFMAATIGLVQNDIKRVLAYSTVSQLGFMFIAMGVGAFAAGTFHLMTHAFFKALLFLCSGSVIHAMAGEQDMRHMGGLKKYLPVTFVTMMVGTLAISGIFPLSGFFSKDEILLKAFLSNKIIWGFAVVAALMTAFYMFRLMAMTFFGAYRGPAWETGGAHGPGHAATGHGGGGHGHGAKGGGADDHGGHGEWHGPHESPKSMTYPLFVLAIGALLAGFFGVPAALGGANHIEHFLEPSFVARAVVAEGATALATNAVPALSEAASAAESKGEAAAGHGAAAGTHEISWWGEMGLMGLSVFVGLLGIFVAYRFYVKAPDIAENLARRFAGPHRVLSNKYYVDEIYDATFIAGTMASARGLWTFDARVVDGAVNGTGWLTMISAWFSHLIDKYVVDGTVNLVGAVLEESSFVLRRVQSGLVQNYALFMLFGVFAFVSVYLFMR